MMVLSIQAKSQKTDAMLFGGVKSESTGKHIPFVNIVVKGTNIGTISDQNGMYRMNVPQGSYVISVSYIGFEISKKKVSVTSETGEIKPLIALWVSVRLCLFELSL